MLRSVCSPLLGVALALAAASVSAQEAPSIPANPFDRPTMTPPRLRSAPEVTLPEGAEPLPPDVSVELLVTIAADGTVSDVVLEAPLREDVDPLVLEAARGMQFEPATRDGVPIPARIRFAFRIGTPEPEPPPATAPAETTPEPAQPGPGETGAPGAPAQPGPQPPPETEPTEPPEPTFGARAVVDRPEPGAVTRITLTGAELNTVPGTFGEPLRVVASLPGVVRSPFGIGFFVVRGANFQSTGYFVDGFPIPILYHFGFGPAVISSRYVNRLRFYPGNYPVSYGRFSGGLIALDTGPPEARSIQGEISIDLLRAAGTLVVPFDNGRGNVSLAFRRSYYELLVPLFVQGINIQYTDYQARIDYRFDRHFSASLFIIGSDDSLDQSGAIGGGVTSEGSNTSIAINFQRAIARAVWRLSDDSSISMGMTIGRDGTFFGTANVGQARQRFALETYNAGLRIDGIFTLAPWLVVNAGMDFLGTLTSIDVTAPAPTGLGEYPRPVFDPQLISLRTTAARGTPGFYAEGVLRLPPVEVSLGLRLDVLRYGTVTTVTPDPRMVARVQILPEWVIKVGTGLFSQPPAAIQTVSTGGNPRLGPSRAWQSSIGTELDLPLDIDVEVNGFYSHMFDLSRFSANVVPGPDGQPRREFFSSDQEGRAYGLEVLIRRPVEDGFYAWISYTLSRSERVNRDGQWVLFNQDQEHVLNLVASYFIDGWRVGGRFVLATGRPTRGIDGGVYDADANAYDPNLLDTYDRLPIYHQLDLRFDRDFNVPPVSGTVYLEVLNVYYAQNSEGVIYQYDYQRSVPLPGVPILGTIGIRGMIE